MRTINVSADKVEVFQKQVKKLNKKASKLGLETVMIQCDYKDIKRKLVYDVYGNSLPFSYVVAYTESEDFFLNLGDHYTLVGSLEAVADQMIVNSFTDMDLHTSYGKAASICDHCNTNRKRNKTFIVQDTNTGDLIQVGSSCMKDFVGQDSVDTMLKLWDEFRFLEESYQQEEVEAANYLSGMGGGSKYSTYRVDEFLTAVVSHINNYGWVSRTKSYETHQPATADEAVALLSAFENSVNVKAHYNGDFLACQKDGNQDEVDTAMNALAWIASVEPTSDYEHNLKVVASATHVAHSHIGILASLIPAYQRHLDATVKASSKPSEWVGDVSKRQTFSNLRLQKVIVTEGFYGFSFGHQFLDAEDNVLMWWTSSVNLETLYHEGTIFTVKATVKDHTEYQDVKQTVVTRLKVEEAIEAEEA